ncbi:MULTISPECIES: Uma2 family endonuclease [unclassified Streptomyces]|uniref:Uma2 family endonuclease n=1 Tax=unclassified Streptomyces TaxID=2593676 RepID=UPI00386DE6C1|nr:Uma2 family endonuclease [Streptomyces sp. NBC_01017]WSV34980.1 Uma2 family endonuclease [Streptomyces sp. NBC_01017]
MTTAWDALPPWMLPPRPSGWEADDLDNAPDLPRHTELIDGALIFMMSPQRSWHARVVTRLTTALEDRAPDGFVIDREMTVKLNAKNRPEPDVLAVTVPYDPDRTRYLPDQVALAVEVVSDESADRDRSLKPVKYAQAGISHYWRIEEENGLPVVHTYELDDTTRAYVATGIYRARMKIAVPFVIDIDLTRLVR